MYAKNAAMKKSILSLCLSVFAFAAMAQSLSKSEADKVRSEVIDTWWKEVYSRTDYITTRKAIVKGDLTMRLSWHVYGEMPHDGRSLYISLHGGGGTTKEVNDQQWKNQWRLYHPKEGVYICPRAPYDLWNMHFVEGMDSMYKDIILYACSHLGVNPDKVYILGYSAGGDGVWRLAPRMADTWAAASMMAGHPGDVSLLGLRNLPFMVWCGANDAAYDRNKVCAQRIAELDSLSKADQGGYIHEGHIVEGKSHWMDRADTLAIDWMSHYKRDPYPKTIAWCQGDELHTDFYWVGAPADELEKGKEVRVRADGNTIYIDKCDYTTLRLYLNDQIVNLDKPVIVKHGKKSLFKQRLRRTRATMESTLRTRQDPRYLFDSEISVEL